MEAKGEQTQKEIVEMLEELEAEQHRLTDWERNFVAEMDDWFDEHGSLSRGQMEKLREIYVRYF